LVIYKKSKNENVKNITEEAILYGAVPFVRVDRFIAKLPVKF
jgi:hypothetical protein